jgi:hypothetical protein
MAANPRVVTTDINLTWDGVTTRVRRGTVVDIPAGGPLETAYGAGNLVAMPSSIPQGDTQPLGDVQG